MNRLLVIFAGGVAAVALAAPALAAGNVQITIRHQMRGCHSWSVANGPWRTGLKLKVDRDTSLFFVNDDVTPQTGLVSNNGSSNDPDLTVKVSLVGTGAVAGDTVQL